MSEHWKHRATRCAVGDCERTRLRGWSTCGRIGHREQGVSLYGLRPGEPRLKPQSLADARPELSHALRTCSVPSRSTCKDW